MNMQQMMAQAQKMQRDLDKKIKEFETKEFEYNYQNGAVIVDIAGNLEIKGLKINPALIDPDDAITLQEMIVEAVNAAVKVVSQKKDSIQNSMTPKSGFPGMF